MLCAMGRLLAQMDQDAVARRQVIPAQGGGAEWTLLNENFNQVHLVGTIPPYRDTLIMHPVEVQLIVRNKGGKQSEPHPFKYTPGKCALV